MGQEVRDAQTALGRQLFDLRRAAGLTQHQLAAVTFVARGSIANIETAGRIPTATFGSGPTSLRMLTEHCWRLMTGYVESGRRRRRPRLDQVRRSASCSECPVRISPSPPIGRVDPARRICSEVRPRSTRHRTLGGPYVRSYPSPAADTSLALMSRQKSFRL